MLYAKAATPIDQHYMDQIKQQGLAPESTDQTKPRFSIVVGPSPFTMPRGWEFFLASPYEGVTYIASVLHNAGYPVRIIDARYRQDPLAEAYAEVMEGCDVLGIATYEDCYPFVEQLVTAVKEARPDLPIVLGGSLVTSVPHVFMRELPVDVAVISEGEITVLEVMEAYASGNVDSRLKDVRGIWYRDRDGQVHRNAPRGQTPDLDFLPPQNLSLWPQSLGPRGMQPQVISSHSRGCKMDCSFCYRTTPQLREKSPEKFRADLQYLKDHYNVNFVFFVDLTFTSNKKRTLEICEVIKEFNIGWTCLTRCADVDPEVLKAMKDSGCDISLYGVESLSPEILKKARKGSSENITLKAMYNTFDSGVRFGGLMIVGLPGETEESLEHACQWAEEHNHITRVKYLSAMPGTTVYQEGLKSGIIKSEVEHLRWLSIEQALVHDEFLNYNGLPEEVSRRAYKRLYDAYQPGPVMNFEHFPEHFEYFYPNKDRDWRAGFSSASAALMPGYEKYRLPRLQPSPNALSKVLQPTIAHV